MLRTIRYSLYFNVVIDVNRFLGVLQHSESAEMINLMKLRKGNLEEMLLLFSSETCITAPFPKTLILK